MIVKIIVKRRFKKGKARDFFALTRKLRAQSMCQKGFISSETLIDHNDPQKTVVIGTFQSLEDWLNWKNSDFRKDCDTKVEKLLEEPAEYDVYVYSKFYLDLTKEGEDIP